MIPEAKPSPLPWEYMPALPNVWAPGIRAADGWYVCTVGDDAPAPLPEANARFIVTACNAHADLLAALKELLESERLHETGCEYDGDDWRCTPGCVLGRARAAIAKAERVQP